MEIDDHVGGLPDAVDVYKRQALLDELGRVGKLALDPETKDRLYAHLRLLYAKEALSALRDKLTIGYAMRPIDAIDLAELGAVS